MTNKIRIQTPTAFDLDSNLRDVLRQVLRNADTDCDTVLSVNVCNAGLRSKVKMRILLDEIVVVKASDGVTHTEVVRFGP